MNVAQIIIEFISVHCFYLCSLSNLLIVTIDIDINVACHKMDG
jgi:hypothetical protein